MRKSILTFLILILPQLIFAQFVNKKRYNISKIKSPPKIDGKLNDIAWQDLDVAKEFSQISPNNGKFEREKQKTEVKICYDNENIYFGVMMYDNAPDSILKELSKRDEENKNFDKFGIWINPFNNGQIEYNFTITAAGVQIDRKFSSSGTDPKWNAVWQSAVEITKEGWIAEFSIPFSQLRFPNDNKKWALNMMRTIRRYREDYSWNPIDIEYGNFALQAGLIEGIKNLKPPIRLSFMPYVSTYLNYDTKVTYPYNYGMDLKYGINESFTLDMTLIPDFGQVGSDAMVLNLSSSEIKYEEKRQFFNEGIELLNKSNDMLYTRRLQNDILNATKITGRTSKGLGVVLLNAITNKTDETPVNNYNAMMLDQVLGKNSSVSLINTSKINKEDVDIVSGILSRINNKKNTHLFSADLKLSRTEEDTAINIGYAGKISIEKTNGNYRYKLYSLIEDEKYNPEDMGIYTEDLLGLRKNNEIRNGLELSYNQLKENSTFIESEFSSEINYQTLFTNQKFVHLEIKLKGQATLKNYTSIFIRANIIPKESNDFYEARENLSQSSNQPFKKSKSLNMRGFISTDYRNRFALDIGGGGSLEPLYEGSILHWRIAPRYRINDKISLQYILSIRNKYNDVGYAVNDTTFGTIFGIRNTNMITNVLSAKYILNNKMDISIKLRYHLDQVKYLSYHLLDNQGYLTDTEYKENNNINYTTWTSDIAYNWWFAPGSQMSIVWKNGIDIRNDNIENHWIDNIQNSFASSQQYSLSLKLIYYLDYLYLRKS